MGVIRSLLNKMVKNMNKKEKTAKNKCGFDRNGNAFPTSDIVMMNRLINLSVCKAGLAEWSMHQSEKLERSQPLVGSKCLTRFPHPAHVPN